MKVLLIYIFEDEKIFKIYMMGWKVQISFEICRIATGAPKARTVKGRGSKPQSIYHLELAHQTDPIRQA
jgi:hypothetical protein